MKTLNMRSGAVIAAIAGLLAALFALGPATAHADALSLAAPPPDGAPAAPPPPPGPAGSFPRSFLIPGSETSISIGGAVTVIVLHIFDHGNPHFTPATLTNTGNNGSLNFITLHVHTVGPPTYAKAGNPIRSGGNNITFISPQQSRVNFETRTPTTWGEARTVMELDWSNGNEFLPGNNALLSTNNLVARLRFAYATLGGLLGGQAASNFADADASADTINFGGNVGDPGVIRIPQIRYTQPLAPWGILGDLSVSAEAPDTDGFAPGAGILGSDAVAIAPPAFVNPFKSPSPDLAMAWYIPEPWGHTDFSVVVRPMLQMKDGAFLDRTFSGYGVHFGGDVKPGWFDWPNDDITWHFVAGDGIGRYLGGNNSEFALVTNYPATAAPATAAAARKVFARTTVSWGGNVGYLHWWAPTLRSNISAGIMHHDINNLGGPDGFVCSGGARFSGAFACGLNKELISANLNLIWQPVPFADIALEYSWGHRLVLSNLKGDVNALLSRFRVNF